ncbi:hypothetical protein SAMN03159496_01452 [Rhizobium sp. NFR07]|uniref:hypothetical protein n=1 Tax=Rhizobium sp. NFR07 TaxID=1566262 RepID=UPI0008E88521|nr:hypothetical protein [Rhizobium sp. NFR07]SFB03782.1 hypothetical protein SAMN03159496_01452 [Rhizobium sp. NFR07]
MTEEVLSDARKEQIKLRAIFLNNIGIGVMLIGVFTPIVRAMYEPAAISGDLALVGATMAILLFGRRSITFGRRFHP